MDSVAVKFAGLAKEFNVSDVLVKLTLFGRNFEIKWYGAIIAFGFLLAVLFGGRIAYKWKINLDKMIDVLIFGTIFGVIGARAYYVIFRWENYKDNLIEVINIRGGGLAIYGGIIGGVAAAYIVCKVEKMNFYNLLDMVGMSLLIGQGIGRWGNFANQEAFGSFTTKPWGMMSDKILAYIQANGEEFGLGNMSSAQITSYVKDNGLYVHPTFLYESVSCLLAFGFLYLCLRKFRKFSGQLFLTYGVWYGVERAIVEGLRTDSLFVGNTRLRVSQLISIILAVVCFTLLVVLLTKYTKHPKPIEGIDYFPPKTEKELKEEERKKQKKAERQKLKENGKVTIRNGMITKDRRKDKQKEITNIEDITERMKDNANN